MIGKSFSHYRILEQIGEGGMGVVFRAEDTELNRPVALKFLGPDLYEDEEARDRFMQEARAVAALNHPNICSIHEIAQVEGQLFLALEYVEGQSLKELISGEQIGADKAIGIIRQVLSGLQAAHEKGIVHRDIKSANVMITTGGLVKIMDFGLAKSLHEGTGIGEYASGGTVAYMSPEQARGEDVDQRSDLWSAGVVLYEMITGRLPFFADYEQALLYKIMNEDPEPVSGRRRGSSAKLAKVIDRALEKDADARYQSAAEMSVDLAQTGKSRPTLDQSPIENLYPQNKPANRMRYLLVPVIALVVLLLGLMIVKLNPFTRHTIAEPRSIAVIGFENLTGDESYDYLAKAIPNLLITSLEQSKYLRVTTWERIHDLLDKTGRPQVDIIDKETGFELCRLDNVYAIVLGSFIKAGDIFATDVKVLDVDTKSLIKSASSQGTGVSSILKKQIDELSAEISRSIGVSERNIETSRVRIADVTTSSMEAYNTFLRGREAYEKFYFQEARRYLEKAIDIDSTFSVAHLYLAWTCAELRDRGDSERAFDHAKLYAQKSSEKERLYIEQAVETDSQNRLRILKQMAKKYPKEKRVCAELASYYHGKRQFPQAIKQLKKAIQLDPNYGYAINQLAYTYADVGKFEQAYEYIDKYVQASPGDVNPLDSMAELYFRRGEYDQAIAKFREVLELRPDFYDSYWKIAYIYALKEDYADAVRSIDELIAHAPTRGIEAKGYWWRGLYLFWTGEFDEAYRDIQKSIDLWNEVGEETEEFTAHLLMGVICLEKAEIAAGRKHIENLLDLLGPYTDLLAKMFTPEIIQSHFYLGMIDLIEGHIDSARDRMHKIESCLPDVDPLLSAQATSLYHTLYSEVLARQDSLDKAIGLLKISRDQERPVLIEESMCCYDLLFQKDLMARLLIQRNDIESAITEYERLVGASPAKRGLGLIHPKYHYRLATLYKKCGKFAQAADEYEKFLTLCSKADPDGKELADARASYAEITESGR